MSGNSKKNSAMLFPQVRQLLLIMRLSLIMMLVMILRVSASAQSITLNTRNASLSSIFKEIRQQSGYDFFFNKELIQKCKPVTINVRNASIESVLNLCLHDQPLTYKIGDKVVMIREKDPDQNKELNDLNAIDVEGSVMDSTGMALIGASVRVRSARISTVTDGNGRFRLSGIGEGAMLEVSYIGYVNFEITVTSRNAGNLNIVLKNDINKLDEVAVVSTGYQVLSKERSAGSFATANMDVVANRSGSMNVLQSLDGQLPGLVVNNAPSRSQFLVRGLSTTGAPALNGNGSYTGTSTQPLYVVDGLVIPDVTSINPQDVESVTLLKDATAASIWGARAANGVIVITTKKGAFNSKLRVTYDGFVNFQGKPDLGYSPMLNSRQFIETGKEIFNTPGYLEEHPWSTVSVYGAGGNGIAPHELILYNLSRGLVTATQANRSLDSLAGIDNHGQIKNLFYRNAMLSNHTISMSGGSDKYSFYGSASYTSNTSNQPGETNNNYKVNFRQDIKAAKFLRIYLITDLSSNNSSAKRNLDIDYTFYPYQMFRDANGNNMSIPFLTNLSDSTLADFSSRSRISLDYNPLNELHYGYTKSDALLARINTGISINLFKGLRFEGNYGYIKGNNKQRDFESLQSYTVRKEIVSFTVAPNATTAPKYYLPSNGGRLTMLAGDQRNWTVRNQLVYDNSWNRHALTVLAGQEAQEQFSTSQTSRVRGYDEDLQTHVPLDYNVLSALVQNTVYPNYGTFGSIMSPDNFSTNETTSRFTSYYSNIAYTYNHKYTINGSWRNDQSNLFGKNKAAQNKPVWSAGAKWNVGSEMFMQQVSWIEMLALRLTYGITGNSPNPGVAASEDITGPLGSAFFPGSIGIRIITPGNDQLSWESTKTTNLGVDFTVLSGRLSGSTDIYLKKTENLLGLVYPNSLNGWPAIVGNQGNITNKGVELNLRSINISSRNFSWTTSLVFAYNKNRIDKLTTGVPFTTGAQQVSAMLKEGLPAFTLFAYKYAGLDNTGAPLVRLADGTVSKDRLITKPEDIAYQGSLQPVWNGGLSNNFQYKNFRLSANMIYNMGHVMTRQRNLLFGGELHRNISVDFLKRWKAPGDEKLTDIPGYITNANPNAGITNVEYFTKGDINVVDASFVKLRDITLFYDVAAHLLKRIKVQGLTLRAQVSNVLLWKANKYSIDPEFQGIIPPTNQKTFTIGAHLSL